MVSLKRYLGHTDEEADLRQVIALLLEKIGSGAAIGNEPEHLSFQSSIARFRDLAGSEATPATILLMAGAAAQALETYNKEISRLIRKQDHELKAMVSGVADAVAEVAGDNTAAAAKLREIARGFEPEISVESIDTLKTQFSECLHGFREEMRILKQQTDEAIISLREEIERGPQPSEKGAPEADRATGLQSKEACVTAMHEAIPKGKRRYVVTLVVGRVQAINARFGYQTGDRVLCRFGEYIEQQIHPSDRLFRWSGPTLVALLERSETLEQVRAEIHRILETRLDHTFNVEGRTVMIPITSTWSAFQLITTVAMAEKQIQTFVASHSSREFA